MRLLDSNIIIYSAQKEYSYLRPLLRDPDSYASYISYIEVLGYHRLSETEKRYFKSAFHLLQQLPVTNAIKEKAAEIRQGRKFTLGDAIIAATALVFDLELYTNNVKDFSAIPGLKVINPIK
jgi:toxin FitB